MRRMEIKSHRHAFRKLNVSCVEEGKSSPPTQQKRMTPVGSGVSLSLVFEVQFVARVRGQMPGQRCVYACVCVRATEREREGRRLSRSQNYAQKLGESRKRGMNRERAQIWEKIARVREN